MSIVPVVGWGVALVASVGPNLVTNIAEGATRREILLDAVTDAIGVPVSAAGGGLTALIGAGAFGLDPSDIGLPLVGGAITSIAYDVWGAPRVYRQLDMRLSSLGW